jgi:mono/diheme cytochrome c family protein
MADPGGSSNTSICSNAACHGFSYEFAGFDAPALREEILATLPTPQPSPTPAVMPEDPEELTYTTIVRGIFDTRCGVCHGETAQAGLNLLTYQTAMAGTENGPVILPGNPDESQLLLKTADPGSHFAQFTNQEVELLRAWIAAGALE